MLSACSSASATSSALFLLVSFVDFSSRRPSAVVKQTNQKGEFARLIREAIDGVLSMGTIVGTSPFVKDVLRRLCYSVNRYCLGAYYFKGK
jgi:hypothetical protein